MEFWHAGIITADVEKTLDTLCAMPGVERKDWSVFDMEFKPSEMLTGTGGKLKVAAGRVNGIIHELIQPLDEHSYHAAVLKNRGTGFHHAAYVCEKNHQEVVASCLAAGGRIVWEALHEGEHVTYLESADGGSVWEIINVRPVMPGE